MYVHWPPPPPPPPFPHRLRFFFVAAAGRPPRSLHGAYVSESEKTAQSFAFGLFNKGEFSFAYAVGTASLVVER